MKSESSIAMEDRLARAAVYKFLSRFLLREVDRESWEWLHAQFSQAPLANMGLNLNASAEADGQLSELDELEADYCRVFIGPRDHVPPYQSICQSGLLQNHAIDSMKKYEEYVSVPNPDEVMTDHIGYQMAVMAEILESDAGGEEEALNSLAKSFFHDHIVWSLALFQRAKPKAESDFYRSLIEMTEEFVTAERELFAV